MEAAPLYRAEGNNMQDITKIWRLPISSQKLDERVTFTTGKMSASLQFSYHEKDDEIKKTALIIFNHVLSFDYTVLKFTDDTLDAIDALVEIENSFWLQKLRSRDAMEYDFWHPKHYAIFFYNMGLYQFIATDYSIEAPAL